MLAGFVGARIENLRPPLPNGPCLVIKGGSFPCQRFFFFFRRGFLRRTRDRGMVGRILDTPFSVGKLSLQGAIDVK